MEIDDILERKVQLISQIKVLEWDKERQQIHTGHKKRLENMKIELNEIENKINEFKEIK